MGDSSKLCPLILGRQDPCMTLILTLIATNKIVQVFDRRLTLNGDVCDSDANKLVYVGCDDARFSIGYTGVAEIDGQRTDYWLVDQIKSIFGSGRRDVLTVYRELANKATSAISRLRYKGRLVNPKRRGLTLALAGYRAISGTTVPFLAYISNVALDAASPFDVQPSFLAKGGCIIRDRLRTGRCSTSTAHKARSRPGINPPARSSGPIGKPRGCLGR